MREPQTDYEKEKATENPIPEPAYDIATALFVFVILAAAILALIGR